MGKYFLGSLFFVPSLYSAELVCGRIHFKIFIECGNVRFGNSLGLFSLYVTISPADWKAASGCPRFLQIVAHTLHKSCLSLLSADILYLERCFPFSGNVIPFLSNAFIRLPIVPTCTFSVSAICFLLYPLTRYS